MQESNRVGWSKRFDDYQQSKEYEICHNLAALESTFSVFKGNFKELMKWIDNLKNTQEFLDKNNIEYMKDIALIIDEFNRLLHNFVASAKSLIDHTRNSDIKTFLKMSNEL